MEAAVRPTSAPCRVVVASQAEMKVAAVRRLMGEGFAAADGEVLSVKAASEINEQPYGHEETIRGAMNRLKNAQAMEPGADFYVAIENGIFEVSLPTIRFFDLAWVVVAGRGHQSLAHSVGVEMPAELVESARAEGFDRTHVGNIIAATYPGVNKQDPHHWLTSERCRREELLLQALTVAWGQLQRLIHPQSG
mmetsp:Transcript_13950/g.38105  ORF Transcript_13950/g.38105 Transcript_13950/m.38105 type:complete len:193 (-) Transcript_13950:18-596(-)